MALGQHWPWTRDMIYVRAEIKTRYNLTAFFSLLRQVEILRRTTERWVVARRALRFSCPGCHTPERDCECERRIREATLAEDAAGALIDQLHRWPMSGDELAGLQVPPDPAIGGAGRQ